jgi:hypothetical protein
MANTTQKRKRGKRRPAVLPPGFVTRGILTDLRESGTWATVESLVQTLCILHNVQASEATDRQLASAVVQACRRLERDACIISVQRLLMGELVQGWQLAPFIGS